MGGCRPGEGLPITALLGVPEAMLAAIQARGGKSAFLKHLGTLDGRLSRDAILAAYASGRGSFRLRARWQVEDLGRGTWQMIVTEIPYQVQKSRLIEALADLIEHKKAPLLGDVRDESAEDIRLILEPKSRTIEPEMLMESLFKLSDLEIRFPINMNVLDASGTPRVMGLKDCLKAFLDHRREVLNRRSQWRIARVEKRLHLLEGLRIVFLNLDEVIRIVREEEQPKAVLIARFGLTEVQADFILDTRLRQLARLEEMTIEKEFNELSEELANLKALTSSEGKQWKAISKELETVRKALISPRRTTIAEAVDTSAFVAPEAFIPREAITVILSERGWIRAAKGKVEDPSELKFKEGDQLAYLVPAYTTDKLLVGASDGRIFTIGADKLASGRGHGEPLRLMIDLDEKAEIIALLAHQLGRFWVHAIHDMLAASALAVAASASAATRRARSWASSARALARSSGSSSVVLLMKGWNHIRACHSSVFAHPADVGRQVFCGIRQSIPSSR